MLSSNIIFMLIRDSVKLKHLTFIFKSNLTHSKSQQKKKKACLSVVDEIAIDYKTLRPYPLFAFLITLKSLN